MKTILPSEQELTTQNSQDRTETGQSKKLKKVARLPKTHVDYWPSRLRKRNYVWEGKRIEIPNWQVRLFYLQKEAWFDLQTANKDAASQKARDIYVFLMANGWDATLAKFKPQAEKTPGKDLTIGQYLSAVEALGHLKEKTFGIYRAAFRIILAGVFNIEGNASKYDTVGEGNKLWAERINKIKLIQLTPERVRDWQRKFVAAAESTLAKQSARRTVNSYVRCARSLFSPKITQDLTGLEIPSPLPFDGVAMLDGGSTKYVSRINAQTLIAAAKNELKANDPEAYKVFLLALFAGMRRGEIDMAEWDMLDFQENAIKLQTTEFLSLKTADSTGKITIDGEVMAELKELMPKSESRFIITSDREARADYSRGDYRAQVAFERLTTWLRAKGIKDHKPLHTLRKEVGAIVATKHGIFAAATFLRHSGIKVTLQHYADYKATISAGIGSMLNNEIKAVTPAEAADVKAA